QPLGAGPGAHVQAAEGERDPDRVPVAGLGLQPVPGVRADPGRRAEGDRGGLPAAARRRGRRVGAHLGRAPGARHRPAAAEPGRGGRRHAGQRAGGRDARRARLRLLPPQQARGVARVPPPGHRVRAEPLPADPLSGPGVRLPGGVSAGHWTDAEGGTGCTVVLVPDGAMAGVDVRGGAPGTLGTDALRPGTLVERAHAVLLTGGSAFGLDAAGGVMRYLEDRGVGFAIGGARVPIVAGADIFDLPTGDPRARPDAAAGYAACRAATGHPGVGAVGAGTGATVAKAG